MKCVVGEGGGRRNAVWVLDDETPDGISGTLKSTQEKPGLFFLS